MQGYVYMQTWLIVGDEDLLAGHDGRVTQMKKILALHSTGLHSEARACRAVHPCNLFPFFLIPFAARVLARQAEPESVSEFDRGRPESPHFTGQMVAQVGEPSVQGANEKAAPPGRCEKSL